MYNSCIAAGPFAAVCITLICTPAGWALAALGSYLQILGVVYLFGVFHGIGTAFAYISITSALQRWYSEFKGLATGIAVMGFGLGSFVLTTVGKNLLDPKGDFAWPVFKVQGVFAAAFFCALLVALPFLREPPPGFCPPTAQYLTERRWVPRFPAVAAPADASGCKTLLTLSTRSLQLAWQTHSNVRPEVQTYAGS